MSDRHDFQRLTGPGGSNMIRPKGSFKGWVGRLQPHQGTTRFKIAALAVLALLATTLPALSARAASGRVFSVHCLRADHTATDDPIVHPNQPGTSHMHSFSGNTTTDAYSTYSSMVGKPTTCNLSLDTSGYWIPTMYDSSGKVVPVRGFNAYYRSWGSFTRFTPFPKDFRLIAGGTTLNPPLLGTGQAAVGYDCVETDPYLPTPPNCGSLWVKAHVVFPTCWDGVNTDSFDHRSHVVYAVGGKCPADHPVPIPRLSLHITYNIHDGRGLFLSSDAAKGMSHGQTLHADFWNTWNQAALEKLVDKCLNNAPAVSCLDVNSTTFAAL
jgi:Domain of unknown function (DUF1996)